MQGRGEARRRHARRGRRRLTGQDADARGVGANTSPARSDACCFFSTRPLGFFLRPGPSKREVVCFSERSNVVPPAWLS